MTQVPNTATDPSVEKLMLSSSPSVAESMANSSLAGLKISNRMKLTAAAVAGVLAGGYFILTGDANGAEVAKTAVDIVTGSGGAEAAASITPAQFNPLLDVQASGADGLAEASAGTSGGATGAENAGSGSMVAEGGTEVAEAGETAALSTTEQVIEATKAELPEHAQYVDDAGKFDRLAAAKDLYATGEYSPEEAYDKARDMAQEWGTAYNENSDEIVSSLA